MTTGYAPCQHTTFWVNTNAAAAAPMNMGQTWIGTIPPPKMAPCAQCQIAALEARVFLLESGARAVEHEAEAEAEREIG